MKLKSEGTRRKHRGFTLVELLVVLSVIGVLIGVLLPAVQAAREAARRIECSNRIKQLALACQLHENKHRFYPSGGWSKNWVGLPELGFGPTQPGGWIYHILPDIEQADLFQLGGGRREQFGDNLRRIESALPALHCPSRRGADLLPLGYNWQPHLALPVITVARNDYAINGGAVYVRHGNGPETVAEAMRFTWPSMRERNGVSHQRSRVRIGDVIDGLSNTYLLGEKHLPRGDYYTGANPGDNESAYGGDDRDLQRFTSLDGRQPLALYPDWRVDELPREVRGARFGSSHSAGVQMALCDGSVRLINYSMDVNVHRHLGDRRDQQVVLLPE